MIVVYGDFTDPLSWFASMRVDRGRLAGTALEWRAVASGRTSRVLSEPPSEELTASCTRARRWHRDRALPGEPTRWQDPSRAPHPGPAVAAYAEAVGADIADHVRHLLFRSFWLDRLDIGNPDALRHLLTVPFLHGSSPSEIVAGYGYAVSISGAPVTTAAWRRAVEWRDAWVGLGRPELPVVVEGEVCLHGVAAVERLGKLTASTHKVRLGSDAGPYPLPPMPLAAQQRSLLRPGLRAVWWDG